MNARRSVAVAAAGFATFVNLYTPQAILPLLAATFHASEEGTSLSVTVSLLAVALVAPFAGGVSDRLGRKRVIVTAAFLLVLPTFMVALAPSLPVLLAWRFAQGLLLPFIFAVAIAYIADECDGPDAIRTTGLYASGTIVGGFSGRFLAGIMSELAGWRAAFAMLALLTALAAAVIALAMPVERRFRPMTGGLRATIAAYLEHLKNRRLLATCAVGFGMLFSLVASFTFINFRFAAAPFDLGPAQLGSVFAVYLLGAVAAPLASSLAARIGRRPTMVIGATCSIIGLLFTLSASLAVAIAGLAATCVGLFVTQALSLSFIGVTVRQAKSAAVGLYVTIYYVGGAIGGVVPLGLWHSYGWPGVVALVIAVLFGMAATAVTFWRPA